MPDTIDLRPATADDRKFLWELHRTSIRPYVEATWGWDEAWQVAHFRERFDPAQFEIVEMEGTAVGCLRVERRPDALFLSVIEIAPAYQGRGIGTSLIRSLMAEAAGRGQPVELQVLRANPAARRLYERLGFVLTSESETHYRMRWGPG